MIEKNINDFFIKSSMIPVIIQNSADQKVLMLAYMNIDALNLTITTGRTWFYSRSRQKLWNKGETSGNIQYVKDILYDCDDDTLLILVDQVGNACHTGEYTCFHNKL